MKFTNLFNRLNPIIICLLLSLIITSKANSIPAFARKYKTSCTTCHIAVTKRNPFGEAFRRNGYVMPERDARLIKEPPLSLGADAWKEQFPDAIWPSSIPSSFPLAAYAHMRIEYDVNSQGLKNQLKFDMPWDYGLMYAGTFGDNFSVFAKWSMEFGFYQLFLRMNSLIGPKSLVNLKIGAFEPGITEGYVTNQNLTLGYAATTDYAAATIQGASDNWRPYSVHEGLELNGIIEHNLQYCVGAVNSLGNTNINPSLSKDFYTRVGYKIGGFGLDGYGFQLDSSDNKYWRDDSFTFGVFAYFGNTMRTDYTNNTSYNNSFNRYGTDLRYQYENMDLHIGYINGIDNNPFNTFLKLTNNVYFAEVDYIFYPWLIGVLRYENIEAKLPTKDKDKFANIIPNVTVLFRQNIRFSLQAMINIQKEKTNNGIITLADNSHVLNWFKFNTFFAF